ncbi:MAG: C40 family peptidase [Coriobacteriia bacterium]
MAKIKRTQAELDKANARITTLQGHLSVRAKSMYRSGPVGIVEVLLGANDFDEFAATWDFLKNLNQQEAESVSELKETKAKAEQYKNDLADQEASAAKTVDEMAAKKRAIQTKLNNRKGMLAGLENEIAALEAAEAAAEARALAAASAEAARAASRRTSAVSPSRTFPAPTRAARSEVVAIATRYLGAPYRWGASGPNSFDCSGFTMFVYDQVGVSLPHSSRAQIGSGQRVSRGDLQPGDLVFFGSPIHHVGIYVGDGAYIHAPSTGDVVKISAVSRSDYAGACRP